MAFDAGMLAFIVKEINNKASNSKIEKIYQPEYDEIIINLRCEDRESRRLLINAGSNNPRICFSSENKENPQVPPMFCMLLRKHLAGAKLIGAVQPEFERVAMLEFSAFDEMGFSTKKYLICEIMGKYSNLILADANKTILGAVKAVDFTTSQKRQVLPGMRYEMPPKQDKANPMEISETEFDTIWDDAAADVRADKFITSSFIGISSAVAREISYRAAGHTDANLRECGSGLKREFFLLVDEIKSGDGSASIVFDENNKPVEYAFIKLTHYGRSMKTVCYDSMSEMIEIFFETRSHGERLKQRAADILRLLTNAENRIVKKISLQNEELAECAEGEKFKLWADLITANMHLVKKGDIEAEVVNYYSEDCENVKIPLDKRLSPSQNAQKYYKKYTKSKTAKCELAKQIEISQSELDYIRTVFDSLTRAETEADFSEIRDELYHSGYAAKMKNYSVKKQSAPAVMKFKTDNGLTVLCGRNNVQNDYLTTKLADKMDWWFHVKNMPGSHAVLVAPDGEPSELDFTQAAQIAAYYSKGADGKNVPVDYTLVKNVKKPSGSKPGFVIYTTNWTAYVTPDEETIKRLRVK